jgi:hypothetical protein
METFEDGISLRTQQEACHTLSEILGISYNEVLKLSPKVEKILSSSGKEKIGYKITISTNSSKQIRKKLTFRTYKGRDGYEIVMKNPFLFEN